MNKFLGVLCINPTFYFNNFDETEYKWVYLQDSSLRAYVRVGLNNNKTNGEEMEVTFGLAKKELYDLATDENKETIRIIQRCIKMGSESVKMCQEVSTILDDQKNQVNAMDDKVETIRTNIKNSNRKLRSIESVFGTLVNKITKHSNKIEHKKNKTPKKMRPDNKIKDTIPVMNITISHVDDDSKEYNETQTTIDNNIKVLSNILDDCAAISKKINSQLKDENLSDLSNKINQVNPKIDDVANRTRIVARTK